MKINRLASILFVIGIQLNYAQTTVDFEELTVPDSGYYNGSTDYSGSGATETFNYNSNGANFNVSYTDGDYTYWSGMAYSNQTDLETADYTNYSAFSETGGGATGSDNYIIGYVWNENILFDNPVQVNSIDVTNAVWTYHYMNGTDGSGTGTYEEGDFLKLKITGILEDDSLTDPIDFYLADYTSGSTSIIADWTSVDLSSLGYVKGLKFQMEAVDTWTPYYFCLDNIVLSAPLDLNHTSLDQIKVYPNPTTDLIHITNIEKASLYLSDYTGKQLYKKENCRLEESLFLSKFEKGVYNILVVKDNHTLTQKIVIE